MPGKLDASLARALGQASRMDARISGYVRKYLDILGFSGPEPALAVREHLGSRWLGRTSWKPGMGTTLIELQRSLWQNESKLESVIAHEVIHHVNVMRANPKEMDAQFALMRMGIRLHGFEHGTDFFEGMRKVNAVMGEGFVTEKSDVVWRTEPTSRSFYVLIMPISVQGNRLGWQWLASFRSEGTKRHLAEKIAAGARLFQSTDPRWTRGAKIERFGGWSMPRGDDPETKRALDDLFASGQQVPAPC